MAERYPLTVGNLSATLTGAELPVGLTLDKIELGGQGIHLAQNPFEFNLKEAGLLRVEVSQASISAFLNHRAPTALSGFNVEIAGGALNVAATANVLLPIRVNATCTLEIEDKRRLYVRLSSVGGLDMVKGLVQAQLDQVNPVFDVDQFPIATEIDKVTLEEGLIRVEGRLLGLK